VLDLCCGPGRHAVGLAQKGFGVTAVDLSPLLLEKARQHAVTSDTNVEFVLADMRSFVRPNAFDLALNFFTAFGYFADRADDQKVLTNIYSSLRPGGCVVIDIISKELLARRYESRVVDMPDGSICGPAHSVH
jgi:SAM-dependent methyltransferase